jgi:glycine cleavage system H protein
MDIPDDLQYTATHEWLRLEGDDAIAGVCDHVQADLGGIVFVGLPKVGAQVVANQAVMVLKSANATIDVRSPISGTITEVNGALEKDPSLVNSNPYGEGWLYRIRIEAGEEIEQLMDSVVYKARFFGGDSPEV